MIELKEDTIALAIIAEDLIWNSDQIWCDILAQQLYAQMMGWA